MLSGLEEKVQKVSDTHQQSLGSSSKEFQEENVETSIDSLFKTQEVQVENVTEVTSSQEKEENEEGVMDFLFFLNENIFPCDINEEEKDFDVDSSI